MIEMKQLHFDCVIKRIISNKFLTWPQGKVSGRRISRLQCAKWTGDYLGMF